MSFDNQQKCPALKKEGVHINQSAYSPKGNGLPRRNAIKKLCLECQTKNCIYENSEKKSKAKQPTQAQIRES